VEKRHGRAGVTHVAGELMDEIKPVVAFIADQTKRDDFVKRFTETCKAFGKLWMPTRPMPSSKRLRPAQGLQGGNPEDLTGAT